MIVDLVFGGKTWGKLQLPEVVTASSGADIIVTEQQVKILNLDAYRTFVKALMLDEELVLTLDNGDCNISSKVVGFTMKSKVVYKKDLAIKGMQGPKVTLVETTADKNTMKVANPSPLELDHGVSLFDIVDESGATVAELKGQLSIVRGSFDSTLGITFKGGNKLTAGSKARLVGKGTEKQSWMSDTIKYINSEFVVTEQFASLSS